MAPCARSPYFLTPEKFIICANDLAYLLASQGRSSEAQYHFEEAIRIDPNYWAAHLNYACLLAAMRRRQQALDHFRTAARSPDSMLRREALGALCAS